MSSVNAGNQARDDDLRSDNFFAAAYPVMTDRSTGIRRHGQELVIDGELTIHGVTRPVALTVEVNGFITDSADGRIRAGLSAAGEINRRDFGVCSNVPIGGGAASDKVRIDIEAGAVLRKQM